VTASGYERAMPFLSHAGVSLRYDRTGAGPVVLLIHAWTCNRTFWERQVQALRDRFTVVTVDLRGHGESSPPRTGYSVGTMAGDLEHLVRALAAPRLAIVGWSMGGVVGMELARRLGDRVTALALVCTTPGGLSDPSNSRAQPERAAEIRTAINDDFRTFVRSFTTGFFKDGERAPLHSWAVTQTQKTPAHAAAATFDALLEADMRPHLAAIKTPTLVLHGRHDALLPLAEGEALAKGLANARLVVFEESAHVPFLEEPEAFNAVLGQFLTGGLDAVTTPAPTPRPAAAPAPDRKPPVATPAPAKPAPKPAPAKPAAKAPTKPTKPKKAAKAPAKKPTKKR
jgi:pimeloyl-ACP methyl ester esterase